MECLKLFLIYIVFTMGWIQITLAGCEANGKIRLTDGSSGLLEVYYNGWGFICDDYWENIDADTSCRILGYEGAIRTLTSRYHPSRNYKLNLIACTGSESSILDCGHTLYRPLFCTVYEHIFIECDTMAAGVSRLISVEAENATAIEVVWSVPVASEQNGNISSFLIEIINSNTSVQFNQTFEVNLVCPISNSATFNQTVTVNAGVTYTVTVRAMNGAELGKRSESLGVTTPEAAAGASRLISVEAENATAIEVVWSAPIASEQNGLISSFLIEIINNNTSAQFNQTFEVNLVYPITNSATFNQTISVDAGLTYTVTVRAMNGAGLGERSESLGVTTPEAIPPNIVPFISSQIMVVRQNPTDVTLQFPPVSTLFLNGILIGYGIRYVGILREVELFGTNGVMNYEELPEVSFIAPPDQELTLSSLTPNYRYVVSVNARNSLGATATVNLSLPSQPTDVPSGVPVNVSLAAVSSNQINLTWSVNLRNVNGRLLAFNVYHSLVNVNNPAVVVYDVRPGDIGPYSMQIGGLSANRYYDVSVSIVNNVGEGMNSTAERVRTFPTLPANNLPPATTPLSSTPTSLVVLIPAQPLFLTADISVIYIIVDTNTPPVFTNYSCTQMYNPVSSSRDGYVSMGSAPAGSICIQAVLGSSYFSGHDDFFEFTLGDGKLTNYNGLTFANFPLDPSFSNHISYYILFRDENGQTSASMSLINGLFTHGVPGAAAELCLICYLLPLAALVIIILITMMISTIVSYFIWDLRKKRVAPPVETVISREQKEEKVPVSQI